MKDITVILNGFYNKCWGLRKFSGSNIYFFAKK